MNKVIHQLDLKLFTAFLSFTHSPLLHRIAKVVSFTGDGWLYFMIMPVAIYFFKPSMVPELAFLTSVGYVTERLSYSILKKIIKRPRPTEAISDFNAFIVPSDRFSMPSGHASAAFLAVTLLVFGVSTSFMPLYAYAVCIALSRVLLGVHFPSDILAGATLGTCIAFLMLSMGEALTNLLYF